uniref:Uncharacterized protein n=1 Tax=Panagrolaimus sp. ES5 TaxID=591445 RepID=A0AC34GUX2_9BILA
MSHFYERSDSDDVTTRLNNDNNKLPLRHYMSADSAITTDSGSSGDDSDEFYSSLNSTDAKEIRRLPRQMALDIEEDPRDSVFTVDRSFSVDSGYTDEFRPSDAASNDLRQASKLAKAWLKRNEFRKKVLSESHFYDLSENVKHYVKKFIRNNDWPATHEIRADIWKVLCHTKDFDVHKRLYTEQLEDLTKSGVKALHPICLSFDGIVVYDHGLKEQGAVTLQRLLIVVECVRPEIRYVPVSFF